jgi:hypothetical protein
MSENRSTYVGGCPPWCRTVGGAEDGGPHAHVSQDLVVGGSAEGTVARMIQLAGSDQVRVVVGDSVVGVDEAETFAHALLRLTADARLAQPGLGFVEQLLQQRGMSTGELALAAGLDVERVRAQRSGAAVLTVREFDRVALAAAQLHCLVDEERPEEVVVPVAEPALEVGLDELDRPVGLDRLDHPVDEPVAPAQVEDAFDGAGWAHLRELMTLAGGSMHHDEPTHEPTDETADEPEPEVDEPADETEPDPGTDADEPGVRPALELVTEPRAAEVEEDWAFAQVELVELIRLGGGPQLPAV